MERGSARRRGIVLASVVAAVAVVAAAGWFVYDRVWASDPTAQMQVVSGDEPVTHSYVVPAGTGAAIARGEKPTIVPQRLEVRVGDTIRIRNEDDAGASVGIFQVGAHQTVTMKFTEPGRLEGTCDLHPSGRFIIDVQE